jgi:hypothetical protein
MFAAVEEFVLQNPPRTRANTREQRERILSVCTARLAADFHHKHVQPPL